MKQRTWLWSYAKSEKIVGSSPEEVIYAYPGNFLCTLKKITSYALRILGVLEET
jgi:hypothetical protein